MENPPNNFADDRQGHSTRAVHGGEKRPRPEYAITQPVFSSATFCFPQTSDLYDFFEGRTERVAEYGRYGNPTQRAAERKLAALEGAEDALLFPSGMNAITSAMLAMLKTGDHLVFTDDCYRRTRQFAKVVLGKFGVGWDIVAPDAAAIEAAIKPTTKLIVTESPTNPYLQVVDLRRLAEVARRNRVKTLIDSTFATPYNQTPLEFGIDLVTHSVTKYINGHNDMLGGVIAGGQGLIDAIRGYQGILGGILDPHACYLLIRGIKTFALRMARQNANAQAIAEFLEKHPRVERVYYPGLPAHATHAIAREQMRGFGGVVSFELRGDLRRVSRFIDAVRIPQIAPSLGGVESLIEQPALMSFFELTTEQRLEVGIRDNLVRMSVGIEDAEDLIADLRQALDAN